MTCCARWPARRNPKPPQANRIRIMTSPHMTVAVALGDRSYDILIGDGLLARAGELVKPHLKRPHV
jgi:hypothetical protein